MKKETIGKIIAILTFALIAVPSVSAMSNGGFETGDLTGWSLYLPDGGTAAAVTTYISDGSTIYGPVEGSYFADLKTDGPGSYTTLTQTVSLVGGETISGNAAFDAQDYIPFNDNAYVRIKDSSGALLDTPWYSDVTTVGSYGETAWTPWSWTAPASGTYIVELGVSNDLDGILDSHALFDGVSSSGTTIPEFPTMAMPVIAVIGMMLLFQRRNGK